MCLHIDLSSGATSDPAMRTADEVLTSGSDLPSMMAGMIEQAAHDRMAQYASYLISLADGCFCCWLLLLLLFIFAASRG